jgi:hypothetical protein
LVFNTVLIVDGLTRIYKPGNIMELETFDILKENGVSCEKRAANGHRERIVVDSQDADPQKIRNLGFRLGHGKGHFQYLMYYKGQFCGIIK